MSLKMKVLLLIHFFSAGTALSWAQKPVGYQALAQECHLKNFKSTYLNFLGAEDSISGTVYDPPVSCVDAQAIDHLASALSVKFSSLATVSKPDLYLVRQSTNEMTDADLHLAVTLQRGSPSSSGKPLNAADAEVSMVHEMGHLLFRAALMKEDPLFQTYLRLEEALAPPHAQLSYIEKLMKTLPPHAPEIDQQDRVQSFFNRSARKVSPTLRMQQKNFNQAYLPLSEFFADLIAVIHYQNLAVMARSIETLAPSPSDFLVRGRDFSTSGTSLEQLKQIQKELQLHQKRLNPHTSLAPARVELGNVLLAERSFNPILAIRVLKCVVKTLRDLNPTGRDFQLDEIRLNQILIESIRTEFKH